MNSVSSSMTSFENLVAAAESLEPIKIDSIEVPAPIKLKEENLLVKATYYNVPPQSKYNFDFIQAQLAALQDSVYTESAPVPKQVVLQQFNFSADRWPMHVVQLSGSNSTATLFATAPLPPPVLKNDSMPLMEVKKGSYAKKEATARREREGGKFKRVKTKWVAATDFFKDKTSSNNLSPYNNPYLSQNYSKMFPTSSITRPTIVINQQRDKT
mmetsp:Transcript_6088/g.8503  ORF Transcript_6088/g.8503 Transcript_6088/m.8503 type:complete len:213 (-) Transcript_6088:52-690(-)|eukprot:CAMPEP_0170069866 /NCGR_PEP_ID=MMETSP0019_2-20121128/8380_1 /TAXON_ID=98059 /ORGANISM="Dinobryon sp., Strain UTEXLB2267" /LENGTH=212 /DNA_ID=CAMNT_0010278017 /DNA_START=141 /DNA_END=779 /DNA_ORIENTATION=-